MSSFFQEPPRLGNRYDDDRVLRSFLRRYLTPHVLAGVEPGLRRLGGRAAGEMIERAPEAEGAPPVHVPFDPWGRRVDEIRISPAWQALHRMPLRRGLSQRHTNGCTRRQDCINLPCFISITRLLRLTAVLLR